MYETEMNLIIQVETEHRSLQDYIYNNWYLQEVPWQMLAITWFIPTVWLHCRDEIQ